MWSCPYCGNHLGMIFHDQQLSGVVCLHPDCGRVDVVDENEIKENRHLYQDSDF